MVAVSFGLQKEQQIVGKNYCRYLVHFAIASRKTTHSVVNLLKIQRFLILMYYIISILQFFATNLCKNLDVYYTQKANCVLLYIRSKAKEIFLRACGAKMFGNKLATKLLHKENRLQNEKTAY